MQPCCMSTHSQSSPVWDMTSAEKLLGIETKPPTAGLFSLQSCLTRLMRMRFPRSLVFQHYRIVQAGAEASMTMGKWLAALLFCAAKWLAALLFCAASAQAQNYPNQPIRLIVPWPPGGGVDTSARIIAG